MITITKVYNHGDESDEIAHGYNEALRFYNFIDRYRPNCAIFINGVCVKQGLLGMDKCRSLENDYR